jgi:RHS repeat-associated protein
VALYDPSAASGAGAIAERYAYTAYGVCQFLNASFGSLTASAYDWTVLYTGRELDDESRLYYYRRRAYHALIGAFLTRDPIELGSNSYTYASAGPLSSTDPYGLLVSPLAPPTNPVTIAYDDLIINIGLGYIIGKVVVEPVAAAAADWWYYDPSWRQDPGLDRCPRRERRPVDPPPPPPETKPDCRKDKTLTPCPQPFLGVTKSVEKVGDDFLATSPRIPSSVHISAVNCKVNKLWPAPNPVCGKDRAFTFHCKGLVTSTAGVWRTKHDMVRIFTCPCCDTSTGDRASVAKPVGTPPGQGAPHFPSDNPSGDYMPGAPGTSGVPRR